MELKLKTEGDFCIVSVQDPRIDAAVAVAFKEAVRTQTPETGSKVVLDLTKVTFIDSSGLGAIVATMKHLAPDRSLILAGLTPAVDKVFKLTRMDSVFSIHAKLEDAVNARCV